MILEDFKGKKPESTQETIKYQNMYKDGICQINKESYSKTIQFLDINYRLANEEDKEITFKKYSEFLNYFDSAVRIQMSFINQPVDIQEFKKMLSIKYQDDDFNEIRIEFMDMLKSQLEKGNNNLVKSKYITFTIDAENLAAARKKLNRVELDILNNFRVMGVVARSLNGYERLKIMHDYMNTDSLKPFSFDYKILAQNGLNSKDYIVPKSFDFREKKTFRMGDSVGAVSYLGITAPELSDKMLVDLLDIDAAIAINMHVQAIDHNQAMKTIRTKKTDIQRMKIEEQKKAVRSGYDMDIIPIDLDQYGEDAQYWLEALSTRNERAFLITIFITVLDSNKKDLENTIFQVKGICQKYNCDFNRLDYLQEQGLMSTLPIGLNEVDIQRSLPTSSIAIIMPFTTQELFQIGYEALYYGLNALSNNLILADRKLLLNPNGLFLGKPGSGKSFASKREISNVFLNTSDDIFICDPDAEYSALVSEFHGQVIKISATSKDHINPLDINLIAQSTEDKDYDPIAMKSDFIISLCELIAGGKKGLEGDAISIIDHCVIKIYEKYLNDPIPENMPILGDLQQELYNYKNAIADRIADCLERYVSGSFSVFNHQTNVNIDNRIVCYDTSEIDKQLKKVGMLTVQEHVWNRVTINRKNKKSTRYYIDEFHLLLRDEQTAAYMIEVWKRFRKWGGIPTAITQNVKDFLASREIENIFDTTDFILMLSQGSGDRDILAEKLSISDEQLEYITGVDQGEGLLFYGNTIIPFVDKFPSDTKLYKIMTTKLSEQS